MKLGLIVMENIKLKPANVPFAEMQFLRSFFAGLFAGYFEGPSPRKLQPHKKPCKRNSAAPFFFFLFCGINPENLYFWDTVTTFFVCAVFSKELAPQWQQERKKGGAQ